ncbi:MAG: acyl-CoA dehydrogenase family protein [Steroidobacteraceae bacterium]|nr:acyl-CoA dehydrogenase family protein [Steroidobacteraceae bacterium]MDW8259875.1 acyl-CoA dehydrogenase family protein [Gammaproteobacteria bacterium]
MWPNFGRLDCPVHVSLAQEIASMTYRYSKDLYAEEHEIFRESYRRFLATEADAHVDQWLEQSAIPRSFWHKAGAAGFLAVGVPESYGGPGGDFLNRIIMAEELGYSVAGASIAPAVIGDGVSEILSHNACEELKRRWLPRMATGDIRFGFAMTEPDTGSDIARIRTTAVRDGDHWVISGAKTYIGNAADADCFLVGCKTKPELGIKGISMIIVEADRPGFHRGRRLHKMGSHLSGTGEFALDHVRVPLGNLVGEVGGGMKVFMTGLNMDRIIWPSIAHAASQRAFDETVAFTKGRKAFGQTIFDFQNTQFRLPKMKTELAVRRAFLDDLIRDWQRTGRLDTTRCAMAKMWLPEMEARIIDQCVQLHGGAGYMDEYPVSRLYTAARLHRIFAGSAEIMRLLVARSI